MYILYILIGLIKVQNFWENCKKVHIFFRLQFMVLTVKERIGDENEDGDVNHLGGRQLQAEAVATVQAKTGTLNLSEKLDMVVKSLCKPLGPFLRAYQSPHNKAIKI